jgi:hypothetical protein
MRAPAIHIRRHALITAAALVLGAQVATAAPAWVGVEPPADWHEDDTRAQAIAANERSRMAFGPGTSVEVDSYQAPGGTAALYVVTLQGLPAEPPGLIARRQLDALQAAPRDAALEPGQTALVSWDEALEDHVAIGAIEWRHTGNETLTLARALIWADAAGAPRQVTAECAMRADAEVQVRPACEAALASLALTGETGERGPLTTEAAASSEGRRGTARSGPSLQPAGDHVSRDSAVIAKSERPDGDSSNRWLIILGAVALILAVYLTTRSGGERRGAGRVEDDLDGSGDDRVEGENDSDRGGDEDSGDEDDEDDDDGDGDEDEAESEDREDDGEDRKP